MSLERAGKPWVHFAAEPGTMHSDSDRGLPEAGIGRREGSIGIPGGCGIPRGEKLRLPHCAERE